jgi:flagellar hook-length control protein FliK
VRTTITTSTSSDVQSSGTSLGSTLWAGGSSPSASSGAACQAHKPSQYNNDNDSASLTFQSQLHKAQKQDDEKPKTQPAETKQDADATNHKPSQACDQAGTATDSEPAGDQPSQADQVADEDLDAAPVPSQTTPVKIKPALQQAVSTEEDTSSAGETGDAADATDIGDTPDNILMSSVAGGDSIVGVMPPMQALLNAPANAGNNDSSPATKAPADAAQAITSFDAAAGSSATSAAIYSTLTGQITKASGATDGNADSDAAGELAQSTAGNATTVINPAATARLDNASSSDSSEDSSGQSADGATVDATELADQLANSATLQARQARLSAIQNPAGLAQQVSQTGAESMEAASQQADQAGPPVQEGQAGGKIFRIGTEVSSASQVLSADSPIAGAENISQSAQTSPDSLAGQLADSFASAAGSGRRVVVKLNPPELGKVEMTLREEFGGLRCTLKVDNLRTLDQLKGETASLTQRLEDSGIQVKSVEVTLASSAGQANSDTSGSANRHGESAAAYTAFSDSGSSRGQGSPGSYTSGRDGQSLPADPQLARNSHSDPAEALSMRDGGINVWL